ncbi:MAG TPA: FG-GAP-like repeat-containing protein [Candidatus Acidoferrales bacterium]|nr:FG-GAP-like repeat-containing protein [Candidatus Acidoferrales bacterium]
MLALAGTFAPPARAQTQAAASPSPTVKPDAKKAKAAYEQGTRAEQQQDWDAAYSAYSDAVSWGPNDREYALRREIARSRLVQTKVDAAERDAISGRLDDARRELMGASYLDPSNKVVRERLAELLAVEPGQVRRATESEVAGPVHLAYQPEKHSFDYRGDTQGAYDELARQFGVEAAFDVDLRSRQVRFHFDDVDFPTAARLLGDMTNTFWRPLSPRLFFVTDDTPQKRRDYDASVVRSVVLPASETPDQMTEILRLVREIAGITRSDLDTPSRTLTLRASPQAIAVATDLIDEIEQPVGELILEIEILEVDRNSARQLGITPPQTAKAFTLSTQQIQEAQQSFQGLVNVITQVFGQPSALSGLTPSQIAALLSSGQIGVGSLLPPLVAFGGGRTTFLATLPGAAANFAQMLSLVRHGRRVLLRAQDGQPATFFVGDRIPVSLATFSSSFAGAGANVQGVSSVNFPTTTFATGATPAFVAATPLRNSSISDLVVANSGDSPGSVTVLLGDGAGNFAPPAQIPPQVGADPVWIATGDFNNDTKLDLAVANKGSNTVSILLGNADGTFTAGTDVKTGASPVSVVAADFHDKTPMHPLDLAVANQGDDSISIFEGKGDGTFPTFTLLQLPTGFEPTALAAVHFTSSGHVDLAVTSTNKTDNTGIVSIFLGNGDGTFTQPALSPFAVGDSPVFVTAADLDGDGILDIATANNGPATATNLGNSVSILLGQADTSGNPTGTFAPPVAERDFPAGNGPGSIAVADYNIDGRPDLAVADSGDSAVSILLNLGGGLFGPNFELPVGTAPVSIATADFNTDNKPDVVTANSGSNNVSVILNTSSFGTGNGLPGTLFPGAQYLDIGLKIKATPRIHANDEVTLQLNFDISSLTSQSFNAIPVISSETVDQTVRLKENETAAVAGFIGTQLTNAIVGTPGIAAVPAIGLFDQNQNTQNQETELMILVTPRMVRLAPRKDHAIYAGQGSIEGQGGAAGPAPLPAPRGEPTPRGERAPAAPPGGEGALPPPGEVAPPPTPAPPPDQR